MIFSENRDPPFRIMLDDQVPVMRGTVAVDEPWLRHHVVAHSNSFQGTHQMSPLKFAPAALLLASLAATAALAAPLGPFAPLTGTWSGDGTIDFKDGHSERLRCRADEAGGRGDT